MEELLLNPNIAYLLLVVGFMLAILALFSPGTGVLEVSALFALLLAGWEIYRMPVNYWALLVLLVGVFPFILAVRKTQRLVYLAAAIATLVVGSVFLFRGEGWRPGVNPFVALAASLLTSGFLWIAVTKTLEASLTAPQHDLGRLIGVIGTAKTDIGEGGSAQVAGELWSARSDQFIPSGTQVRVIDQEGFTLKVEQV